MIPARVNIWTRLLLAFVFISSLTLLVGVMALLIFGYSSTLMEEISEEHLPEIVQVAEFARIGGEIVAVAPNILTAPDDDVRTAVKKDLDHLLTQISEQLETLSIPQSEFRERVEKVVTSLKDNLNDLQQSVALQGEQHRLLDRKTERLRWLYADLMGELEPLSQDYAYNVDAEVERIVDRAKEGANDVSATLLQQSMKVKEAIEKTRSNSALLVNLMMQASTLENRDRLENMGMLAEDTIATLIQDMKDLKDDISSLTLRQTLADVNNLAVGKESVFTIKAGIIDYDVQGQDILKLNRVYVADLNKIIDEIVLKSETKVNAAAAGTRDTLRRAHTALVLMVLLSFITVAAVMWFYVRGSIVKRLANLSKSMRAISKGNLSYEVVESGNDEIGKMAAALKVFRDTAIEVEEANAQAIIDNAAVGLILANPDGIIHALNPRAEELFAADPEILVGTSAFKIVVPGDRERLEHACSEILNGAEDDYDVDTYSCRKVNETCFPTDIFITKVQQRSSIRLMITVHDVTEREQAHELLRARVREKTDHLRKINEKLREEVKERKRVQNELVQAGKLAALGQLSAGIAHELNQPLSAIRYYLHNAEKLLELDEVELHRKNLEKMEELVERMASMINHLKNFARRQQEQLGRINIVPVIDRALELFSEKIEKNNIRVIRENEATLIEAYGEETGLEQVLLNIIGNAIDVLLDNPEDDRELSIKVGERNDKITIDIMDNGSGLTVQAPEVVFDPFYTTKEVGQGLGLGLSISYNLIKSFGGAINAVNCQTGGAVFTVTLQKSTMDN